MCSVRVTGVRRLVSVEFGQMAAVRKALSLLALYLAALAMVAAWPTPVDKPARGWLRARLENVPARYRPGRVLFPVGPGPVDPAGGEGCSFK
jgi:hypothetical protein